MTKRLNNPIASTQIERNRSGPGRPLFEVKNMNFHYPDSGALFKDFNLVLPEGEVICIVGQNGCGKSTLLNLLAKGLEVTRGSISLQGYPLTGFRKKEFAKKVAMVHQQNRVPADLTVEELVGYGRTPHNSLLRMRLTERDWESISRALDWTHTEELRRRAVGTLSYGQLQRVWIAMALAQETDILFLDEPTNFLDVRYQIEVLRLVRELNRSKKMSIVMVLHDINQAIAYSDRVVALKSGELLLNGSVEEFLDRSLLAKIYDIELDIMETDKGKVVLTV